MRVIYGKPKTRIITIELTNEEINLNQNRRADWY